MIKACVLKQEKLHDGFMISATGPHVTVSSSNVLGSDHRQDAKYMKLESIQGRCTRANIKKAEGKILYSIASYEVVCMCWL